MNACVFCEIVAGTAPATILREWEDALCIVPLNPVTPGHRLILPKLHVVDAAVDPAVTAAVARRAAQAVRQGEHLATTLDEVADFLGRTYAVVAAGAEYEGADVDAELADLLGGGERR